MKENNTVSMHNRRILCVVINQLVKFDKIYSNIMNQSYLAVVINSLQIEVVNMINHVSLLKFRTHYV